MNPQLPLALCLRPPLSLEDFIAGPNAPALAAIRSLLTGGEQTQIYVSGGPASGKTHLLVGACEDWDSRVGGTGGGAVYLSLGDHADYRVELLDGLEQHGLIAVDDLQAIAGVADWEEALFVFYNRARAAGCRLLLAGSGGPSVLPLRLADLRSRLAWGLSYQLQPLDDRDKTRLLQRQAERRGLILPGEVARYILDRHSRDLPSLLALLERLDRASLAERRRLTLPFVRAEMAQTAGGR